MVGRSADQAPARRGSLCQSAHSAIVLPAMLWPLDTPRCTRDNARMDPAGAYTADRAAALSGVPRSTVHYWARQGIVVPSVSRQRVKLWAYADLFALRTVYWLRRRKTTKAGHEVPPTTMRVVRVALRHLARLELGIFHDGRPTVVVDETGRLFVSPPGGPPHDVEGQTLADGLLDLLAPFETAERTRGVDLQSPARLVRILPRKLAGAPHVVDARIDTEGLATLAARGFDAAAMVRLYPDLTEEQVLDALGLEERLAKNLAA